MAVLAKRVRVAGRGGAGPFHLPQKPGRVNHFSARAKYRKPTEAPIELAQVRERNERAAGPVRRALDRLRFRRAA